MTRFEKRVLIGLGLLILVLSILEAMVPQPTDWSPSYSRFHRKPFGDELVFERLHDLFPEVRSTTEPLDGPGRSRHADQVAAEPVNHLIIDERFSPDVIASERLLDLVRWGDHAFIAASALQGPLADSLGIAVGNTAWLPEDTICEIRFVGEQRIAEGVFRYSRGAPDSHFTRHDSARTRIMAVDGSASPVLLEMNWGKGRFVLCSTPTALTNYHLLKGRNDRFIAGALSILPVRPLIWDEFHKVGRMESQTPIRYLLSQPALRWAWYLGLALVVLYIVAHARRQQRAIPIMKPLRNASRDLMHTIGRLYWHKGDHGDLARKMITHFKEDIRRRTYLRTFAYDPATIEHLAAKTGSTREDTAQRLNAIAAREGGRPISETELLALSNELHAIRELIR